jgi:riboflavin kinase/FMN adenylyltransferase
MQVYTGIVEKGGKRATALGFPTVNIPLADDSVSGIYAAKVKVGEEEYDAVAYADQRGKKLETHLFDFSADLYGWNIRVELLHKLRDEKRFPDDTHARDAITKDVKKAQAYFMSKHKKIE